MNNKPLVSILIPIYNTALYIKRCAESVFAQTYKNIEIIFFDDKSPDNSVAILEDLIASYRDKDFQIPPYKIIRAKRNCGLPEARNQSIAAANGDYIFFLDSDDCIPANAIEDLAHEAVANNADIVKGQFQMILQDGTLRNFLTDYPKNKTAFINKLLDWRTLPLSVCGAIFRKTIITGNNLKFNSGHNLGEDFSMLARIVYFSDKICAIPDFTYYYQSNPSSITHNFSKRNASDFVANSDLVFDFYKSKSDYGIYEKSLATGRAKIKCYILCYLSDKGRKDFFKVFPDLKKSPFISIWGKLKLCSVKYSPFVYKILNKLNPGF